MVKSLGPSIVRAGSLEFRIPDNSQIITALFFRKMSALSFIARMASAPYWRPIRRSALVLRKVCHIKGGMIAWVKAGGAVAPRLQKVKGEDKRVKCYINPSACRSGRAL